MASDDILSNGDYDALYSRILTMGVVDKIKLATSGNQAARSILVRDPNKWLRSLSSNLRTFRRPRSNQ